MIWEIGIWGIGAIVIMNVIFPAWWIVLKKRKGFAGMGITTKRIGLALTPSLSELRISQSRPTCCP